ncbi:MAG: M48 family metallopeptidase [Acidimicrobiales bacterium]
MYDQVAANKRRSVYLGAGFVVVLAAIGWAFNVVVGGGPVGLVLALAVSAAVAFGAWWKSDAVALAMSHARPADPVVHARLHNLVEGLCIAAGLPKPRVYVVEDDAPNAFATGRNPRHAAVAVTTGLLAKLNRVELEGVVAHELSHVKNYDILVSTLAVTMVGMAVLMSEWGLRFLWWGGPSHRRDQRDRSGPGPAAVIAIVGLVFLLLAPVAARLMQFAVSRRREALADVTGVALTRYPPGLIAALEKLRDDTTVVHSGSAATAHLWIESPVARRPPEGRMAWLGRMFDTPPPLEERIQALREL